MNYEPRNLDYFMIGGVLRLAGYVVLWNAADMDKDVFTRCSFGLGRYEYNPIRLMLDNNHNNLIGGVRCYDTEIGMYAEAELNMQLDGINDILKKLETNRSYKLTPMFSVNKSRSLQVLLNNLHYEEYRHIEDADLFAVSLTNFNEE